MRGTHGVAVDGSVSSDPSLNYFAWLLIVYNKLEAEIRDLEVLQGDQRSRYVWGVRL
jgi:hypothetical protein